MQWISFIAASALLAQSPSPSQSNSKWIYIGENDAGITMYIDQNSIKRNKNIVWFWTLLEKEFAEDGVKYFDTYSSANCNRPRSYRDRITIALDIDFNIVSENDTPTELKQVQIDSVFNDVLSYACSH